MDLGLTGKVALVTAASQGLGKAAAMELASEGARVAVCSRSESSIQATAREIEASCGCEVLPLVADVTRQENITKLVQTTVAQLGSVDVLINNAGGPPPGTFFSTPDPDWEKAFELTLMSAVRLTRAALPHMQSKKWGRIVNIASYSVKQPVDGLTLSNSLRLSVIGWAKSLANEVAKDNILINTVCPGWTRTDRVKQLLNDRATQQNRPADEIEADLTQAIPMGRMGTPEELAALIAFFASDRASYITGTAVQVDGGLVQGF